MICPAENNFALLDVLHLLTLVSLALMAAKVHTECHTKRSAEDMGNHGESFRWDEERRAHLRDELCHILDPKDDYGDDFLCETFRVLKEEIKQYGEYRTQRLVLAAWDKLFGG